MTIPTPTDFDALAQRRLAATAPDVGALVARELDRRAADAADREQAAELARLRGGPCAGCGQVLSLVLQDFAAENGNAAIRTEVQPYWRPCGGAQLCYQCTELLGTATSLDDLKGAIVYELLPADESRFWQHPALAARVRGLPLLWCERPGQATRSTPGPVHERFPWVDLGAILAALAPPTVEYGTGPACPNCGETSRWVDDPGGEEQIFDRQGRASLATVRPSTWCANCTTRPASPGQAAARSTTDPGWLGGPLGSLDPRHPAEIRQ